MEFMSTAIHVDFSTSKKDDVEKKSEPEVEEDTKCLLNRMMIYVASLRKSGLPCDQVHDTCHKKFKLWPSLNTLSHIDIELIREDRLFPILEVMYMLTDEFKSRTNHTDSLNRCGKWIEHNHPYAWDELK